MRGVVRVSLPEKTYEHWLSAYVLYRFLSKAAIWWPVNGNDIEIENIPRRPGKVVNFEVKTASFDSTRAETHLVNINLRQLYQYLQLRIGEQPFYVFPIPTWPGDLTVAARVAGINRSDVGFSRSQSWWFSEWTFVMSAAHVAQKLGVTPLTVPAHRVGIRQLFTVDSRNGAVQWARQGAAQNPPPPTITWKWRAFWSWILKCGDDEASQIFIVNESALKSRDTTYQGLRDALVTPYIEQSPSEMVAYIALGDDRYERVPLDQLPSPNLRNQDSRAEDAVHRFAIHVDGAALFVDD